MSYIIIGNIIFVVILIIAIIYYKNLAKKRQSEKLGLIKDNIELSTKMIDMANKNEDLQRQIKAIETVYEDNLKTLKQYEKSKSNLEQALKLLNQEDYNKIRRYL